MMQHDAQFLRAVTAALAASLLFGLAPAWARGHHGFHQRFREPATHGEAFANGRRHGDDAYMKAASEEREKLLNTQLKSICRGC
jgi:hypothetical protein